MTVLVTGSAGHLGEALVRTWRDAGRAVRGLDRQPSPFTDIVASITDADTVHTAMRGVQAVVHTATLHKPHVATHTRQAFVDTNITGTLNLLEAASAAGVSAFVFTSTTSSFGDALRPPAHAPAVWVTEQLLPQPRNIYGVTKLAAEDLCQLFHRNHGLPVVALRTSRFFPEDDDAAQMRSRYTDANLKANELLYRRVDIADVVEAHERALERAPAIGFGCYIVSATTPFRRDEAARLRHDAPGVLAAHFPQATGLYARRGWTMFDGIDRVYDNTAARQALGWEPRYDFAHVLDCLQHDRDPRSELARAVGRKPYHDRSFDQGPYPVDLSD
jgi:UDP-glucose 4-epimerase